MNMSYCKFQNTLEALQDCVDSLNEKLSPEEERARKLLIELCKEVSDEN